MIAWLEVQNILKNFNLIKNSSFLFLKALTILIMTSSGKYWTFDPNDTTITPCSAEWTISSISTKY